jgi:hypothetical protein
MKNKLVVMGITFILLIALTPLIFGKLMNAKYNQMLDNLRKEGIKIEVVKDKSTYLKTDKILHVIIPAKLLNSEGFVNSLDLEIETKFNNLPVTNVLFLGKVNKLVLEPAFAEYENTINAFLKKYISFVVTTPNFRDYSYRFKNVNIQDDINIGIENIKGTFSYSGQIKNTLSIADAFAKNQKGLVEIKNFKNSYEEANNESFSRSDFNLNIDFKPFRLQVNKLYSTTKTFISDKVNIISTLGFDTLRAPNIASADKFKLRAEVKGLEKETLEKISAAKNSNEREQYLNGIFEKGFDININSSIKDIIAMKQKLGGYKLDLSLRFLPTDNIQQKLHSNSMDFVEAKLHFVSTPQIATLIMNLYPQSSFIFALAKKNNGNVELNLELKDGKLYSEGQLIK